MELRRATHDLVCNVDPVFAKREKPRVVAAHNTEFNKSDAFV